MVTSDKKKCRDKKVTYFIKFVKILIWLNLLLGTLNLCFWVILGYQRNQVPSLMSFLLVPFMVIFLRRIVSKTSENLISPEEVSIKKTPASFLLKVAELLPKKYKQDLEQNISDMRLEYYEALSEKRIWRAKCIAAFYYVGLVWSVAMWISDKVKEVIGIIPKKN